MVKKVIALILSTILVLTFAACGDNDVSQKPQVSETKDSQDSGLEGGQDSNVEDVDGRTDNDDGLEAFSETLTFMGFNFSYPQSVNMVHSDYGQIFRYNTDIAVLLEAPSVAGVWMDITDINDAATASKEYVIQTFETSVRELFNFDDTTQTITNSEVKSINGIEMLRVEGFFTNTRQDTEIPFVGYYFLVDTDPIYFVAVSLNEDVTVNAFIDKFAGYVEDLIKD